MAYITIAIIAAIGTGSRQAAAAIAVFLMIEILMLFKYLRNISFTSPLIKMVPLLLLSAFIIISPRMSRYLPIDSENTFARIVEGYQSGNLGSHRIQYTREAMDYLDLKTFLVGMGEGMTLASLDIAPHNGYLIVLLENGIIGFSLLIFLSIYPIVKSYKLLVRIRFAPSRASTAIACFGVSITWAFFVLVNWAQLNDSVSFLYLLLYFTYLSFFTPREKQMFAKRPAFGIKPPSVHKDAIKVVTRNTRA